MADIELLREQAGAGDKRAQCELGARLLAGREAPFSPEAGIRMIDAAAVQDDTRALQLAGLLAAIGIGRKQSWVEALRRVARAAELGDARAQGQMAILGDPARFDVAAWLASPVLRPHFDAPRVFTIAGFLTAPACAWLVKISKDRQKPATINDAERGIIADPGRSNTSAPFSMIDSDLVSHLVRLRIAAAIGVPITHQEPPNVLHYTPGQEYRPHYDFIRPDESAAFSTELSAFGQRVATVLVYLNDGYEGGETHFPRLNWSFKGKTGDALIFWNLSAGGKLEGNSLHAGLPVRAGEKWLLSQWVRQSPLPMESWAIRLA